MSFDAKQFLDGLFEGPTVVIERVEPSVTVMTEPELGGDAGPAQLPDATLPTEWTAGNIDWPDPCERCGSLLFWWNLLEQRRCLECDPPTRGLRFLKNAERIRRQHGLPEYPGVAEMLDTIIKITDT